jgi:hypothetical protein
MPRQVGEGGLIRRADVSAEFQEHPVDRHGGGLVVAELERLADLATSPGELDIQGLVVDRPGDQLGLLEASQELAVIGRGRLGLGAGPLADLVEGAAISVEQSQGRAHAMVGAMRGGEMAEPRAQGAERDRVAAQLRQILLDGLAGGPVLTSGRLAEQARLGVEDLAELAEALLGVDVGEAFHGPLQLVEPATGRGRQQPPRQALG